MNYLHSHGNIIISSSIAIGLVITAIGGWFAQNRMLAAQTETIATESREVNNMQDKQIAAVVEAVQTIKDDNREIKADIKLLLQRTR